MTGRVDFILGAVLLNVARMVRLVLDLFGSLVPHCGLAPVGQPAVPARAATPRKRSPKAK